MLHCQSPTHPPTHPPPVSNPLTAARARTPGRTRLPARPGCRGATAASAPPPGTVTPAATTSRGAAPGAARTTGRTTSTAPSWAPRAAAGEGRPRVLGAGRGLFRLASQPFAGLSARKSAGAGKVCGQAEQSRRLHTKLCLMFACRQDQFICLHLRDKLSITTLAVQAAQGPRRLLLHAG